jgi:hypothetical protein
MNESIHGERTASEPQDRVTELIEQQTAISEVLRAIASSPHDLQPSSTPSSTAPHVSVVTSIDSPNDSDSRVQSSRPPNPAPRTKIFIFICQP